MEGITMTPSVKRMVYDQLDYMGISPVIKGYGYIADLVCRVLENPDSLHRLVKLYEEVGVSQNSIGPRVERAVRHAIEAFFTNKMDPNNPMWAWFSYVSPSKGKPTNGEFIATVANQVRRDLEDRASDSEVPGQTYMAYMG